MEFKEWLLHEDSTFLGWNDLVNQLNQFVNRIIRKKTDDSDGVHISLEPGANQKYADIHVYMKPSPGDTHTPDKLLQGVQYFLQDQGVQAQQVSEDPYGVVLRLAGAQMYNQGTSGRRGMRQAMKRGTGIDVRQIGFEVEPGIFRLSQYVPGADYFDAKSKNFISWIGKERGTGEIVASVGNGYYGNPDYETVWMR